MPSLNESSVANLTTGSQSRTKDDATVLVRKLGAAVVPTYLERVLTQDGAVQFVVIERYARGNMTDDEASECLREARTAAGLEHPNVGRARSIAVRAEELCVTSDYVAGERLSDLWCADSPLNARLPLEIALRILVDAASGLGALHKLRSEEGQERIKFVHGEVTDANVLVGLDGISQILRAARVRRPGVPPTVGVGTIAPEILAGEAADQRADVYSLGALLWQALSRQPLFANKDVAAILASLRQGPVARANVPREAPWALPLADVAARALAVAPDKRFPTASSMITEVRRIAGPKLAAAEQVARFVETTAGDKIAARIGDVQASAVIRKATSIPAPPPSREPPAVNVERPRVRSMPPAEKIERTESKPPADEERTIPLQARHLVPAERRSAAPLEAQRVAPTSVAPRVSSGPTKSEIARTVPLRSVSNPPQREIVRKDAVRASVSPKIETGRVDAPPPPPNEPSPAAPPSTSVPAPTPAMALARPAEKASNDLAPQPAPKPRRASPAARPPLPNRPSAARAPIVAPQRSFFARRAAWLLTGLLLVVALVTGGLALQAIRHREEIATPGVVPVQTAAPPSPVAGAVRSEPVEQPAAPAAAPAANARAETPSMRTDAGPATSSTAKAHPAPAPVPRKGPPAKPVRK